MSDFPWLSVLVALPLVGAFVVPSLRGATAKQTGLGFSLATLVLSVLVAAQYELDGGMQLTETYEWIPAFGVHFALGVDGLGLLMVLLTTLLVPIVLLAAWREDEADNPAHVDGNPQGKAHVFVAWALALEALSLAVFLATDVFLFYIVFEATLIPAYFLVGGFGRLGRSAAAVKFLMFQLHFVYPRY